MIREEPLCAKCGHPGIAHVRGARCLVVQCACQVFTPTKRHNKYNAKPTVVDGVSFHSEGEAKRWMELQWLAKAGEITDLERQRRFELSVNGIVLGSYIADFCYRRGGAFVVEDFKGVATPLYRWKRKHMAAQYGIQIEEVGQCRKSRSRQSWRKSAMANWSGRSMRRSRKP